MQNDDLMHVDIYPILANDRFLTYAHAGSDDVLMLAQMQSEGLAAAPLYGCDLFRRLGLPLL